MDDLFVVEVAEAIDELINEVLSLWDGESFSFFDQIEHVLALGTGLPHWCIIRAACRHFTHLQRPVKAGIRSCVSLPCVGGSRTPSVVMAYVLFAWLWVFRDSFC